ncbi:MAG: MFS transporter [Pseudacidovorax sp.]|uniref:MFS transporter n=1 Tax=Pseudacidovorax sp. TaxID=1934311 RepID=UPI001B6C23CA|nr:MFS transporter [Pseudacidovorax sp.]MBP6896832.1 MFS transporter [Pseudacidovorax sp.]
MPPPVAVPSPSSDFPPARQQRIAFAMLMLTLAMAALDQTILSTALPVMARELPGRWPLAWAFSSYLLAATVVITLYGRLADLLGTRRVLLWALGLFLLGSLACGASRSVPQLVLARAVQGAGGGGLMTLAMLSVASLFPLEQRPRFQSLLGAAYGIATLFGPLLGGTLVEHLTWHWAFWLNVPLALLAAGLLAMTLPAGRRHGAADARIDWPGGALLAGALVLLLLATQRGRLGLPPALGLGPLLAGGLALAALFLWRQQRAAHPLLPLSLFAPAAYRAASLMAMSSGVALYAAVALLPPYLQDRLHLSPTGSAWHLLPLMGGVTFAAIGSGRLLRARRSPVTVARAACASMVLGFVLLAGALQWWPTQPLALSLGLLPLGIGLGLVFPVVTVVSQRTSPVQHLGIATAVPVMLRSLGGAGGVALLAALLVHRVEAEMATVTAVAAAAPAGLASPAVAQALTGAHGHGLRSVFLIAGLAVLGAGLCTRWLPVRLTPAADGAGRPAARPAT